MKKLFILATLCLFVTISALSQSKKEWERVQTLNKWNVYHQFILNYPDGKYTELAKQKLAQLKEPEIKTKKVETNKITVAEPVGKDHVVIPTVKAQNNDQIVIKKKFAYLNGEKLTRNELKDLLLSETESEIEYNKAKSNATIGTVPMVIGTGLALYGSIISLSSSIKEANSLSNGKIETTDPSKYVTPILAGCGLVLIGIPFIIASNSHLKKSINVYNSKQTATGYRNALKMDIGLTRNGVGVVYHF